MNRIELYHFIFLTAAAFAILFLIVSIVLFFVFDIRRMIGIKTGKSKKKSIEQLKKIQSRGVEEKRQIVRSAPPQKKNRKDIVTEKLTKGGEATEVLKIHVSEKRETGFVVTAEIMEIHSEQLIDGI